MAHFAFISPPFLGHLNPMAALAHELIGRGHRATFLQMPDAKALLAGRGVAFRPVGETTHPPGRLREVTDRIAGLRGMWGLGGIIRDVTSATAMLCRDLPDALRAIGADLIVSDQTEAAGGLVAEHLGLPYVSVANALPLNREPEIPPPFTGWRYDPSAWGIERNRGGYRVSDWLMRPHREVISAFAEQWGLGSRTSLEDCVSPYAQISQTVAGLDFPRRALPATFHHVGPLRSGSLAPGFALPPSDGRLLLYASLGTLQGSRARLFRTIASGVAQSGRRLLIAHGGRLSRSDIERLRGEPMVFDFVDQEAVLREAELAVLNGGLNTVLDALTAGTPAMVVPIAFEQGAIAARLARAGAGVSLSRRTLTARGLARAIARVAGDPSFRRAAVRLKAEIERAGGVRRAADIVETMLATGRPVLRDLASPVLAEVA